MTVSWLDTLSWKPVSKTASLHPFSCSADEWQDHRTHYQPHCIQNTLHGHCCLSFWSHCAVTQCRPVCTVHITRRRCWPLSERGRKSYRWRGRGVMQHAAGSSPGQPSVARQSLGRGCLQTACATQTLPARVPVKNMCHFCWLFFKFFMKFFKMFFLTQILLLLRYIYTLILTLNFLTRFSGSGGMMM